MDQDIIESEKRIRTFKPKGWFPYHAKECLTVEQCVEALTHYASVEQDIPSGQYNNFVDCTTAIRKRLIALGKTSTIDIPIHLVNQDRLLYYHRAIITSVEFLQDKPYGPYLDELYVCIQEGLRLSGKEWDEKSMYTDVSSFHLAFTKKEKIVQFINKVVQSGFRETKELISIMNMYIKLINILQLKEELSVVLPTKKTLHDISLVNIPNFSY